MDKRKMRKHNLDIHCNAGFRWRNIGTSRTYKDFKPKTEKNLQKCEKRTQKQESKEKQERTGAEKSKKEIGTGKHGSTG